MKRLVLLIVLTISTFTVYSQYYYLPHTYLKGNPGGLNRDMEFPTNNTSFDTTWHVIDPGSAATPHWTAVQNLPFSFTLSSQSFSSYKISTSGVLTFSTAATTVPSGNNTALPGTDVPDNSICIWGLSGVGSNDAILVKTFGTAPYRQYWVQFSSYDFYGGAATCWTYWAIVLEETTNHVYLVDLRNYSATGCQPSLTLGIQFSASSAVQVAASPNVQSVVGEDASYRNNVYYEFIPGVQPARDFTVYATTMPHFPLIASAPFNIACSLFNLGSSAVSSFTLNYSINGGGTVSQQMSTTVQSFASSAQLFTSTFNPPVSGLYEFRIWASDLDGNPDQNPGNDTLNFQVFVADTLSQRMVLFEHFTSSTCGPCATYNPAVDALLEANRTKVAPIKYHVNWPAPGNDPMYQFNVADNQAAVNYYGVGSVPNSVIGNVYNGHPSGFTQALINSEYTRPAIFRISGAFAVTGGNTITVQADAVSEVQYNFAYLAFKIAVVEKHIHYNTAPGINNETDFYSVLRKKLPDAEGTSLGPQAVNQHNLCTYSWTFDPSVVHADSLTVVAYVQDDVTREYYQAAVLQPGVITGLPGPSVSDELTVFPNPATGETSVSFSLQHAGNVSYRICNMMGAEVSRAAMGVMGEGTHMFRVSLGDLPTDVYFLNLTAGSKTVTRKILVRN